MPHTSQGPGPSLTISGCIGLTHLPARCLSSTSPPAPIRALVTARTNMPGLSRPSVLSTFTRTFAERVCSWTTSSMKETVPVIISPGRASAWIRTS